MLYWRIASWSIFRVAVEPIGLAGGPGILATTTSFQRVYAIVPLVGKGTHDDPTRPMFVRWAAA